MTAAAAGPVSIHRLIDLDAAGHDSSALMDGITAIFRATAARWPDDAVAARAFQHLWLDQYLEHERELAYVAMAGAAVAGYLVGCRINPAASPRFTQLSYFQTFAAECADYPAHLHINLAADFRGQRIGEKLIEALAAALTREGIPGVHAVTGRDQRNVSFYKRLGFHELARAPKGSTEVLFLARRLR